ncbi:signal peptide plus transmembrane domain or GPI anchor [Cryptosporidium canis]|uniref:Signal peptide plus transmembrane domain or GPI anchor n=1 Tax=Cryptosporidium canis TaxID=195482 RepID=A0ABQ8PAI0_9CRYT|nr:signal peptide plus transmembrane domain or GPI anchor [Cryptosporidium canis]
MNKSLLTQYFFLLVVILLSWTGGLLGEKYEAAEYEECENPEFVFPWRNDYLNACLGFQCHRVRQHKSWFRFWDKSPKYVHQNVNGGEQVIQCSDCKGFLKKGTLFGGMSVCTPIEFGGDFDTPKGWVSIATASLQINKEIKSKSSIKLIPDNWRIDGETSRTVLDLSKCSVSEEDSSVALSIIVTLSNIADPSKKSPKYRQILGLSDDSINVRIKTLGYDADSSMDGPDDDDDDDDDYDDYYEGEDPQQGMAPDDGVHEYLLYDMNRMTSTHRIPRDMSDKKPTSKRRRVKAQKPFVGVEKLPGKWKLSKGQASIYSSSDIVKLDLASDLHPNELVEAILTCNNKYMNCNIQDFVSCFNILCKSVTKEELIRRAALKKARQFISDSIITGRTQPIMGYGGIPFQPPFTNGLVNVNAMQAPSIPRVQGAATIAGSGSSSLNIQSSGGMLNRDVSSSANVRDRPQTGTLAGGGNYGVPRMVFANSGPQMSSLNANVMGVQNPALYKNPNLNIAPGRAQTNIQSQRAPDLVSVNITGAAAKPQAVVSGQQKPGSTKVVIVNSGESAPNKLNISGSSQKAAQQGQSYQPINIRFTESAPTSSTTNYIIKGVDTNVTPAPVQYKLILEQKPTTTTYTQVMKPTPVTKPVSQPQVINIKLRQPQALNSIKVVPKEPETIKLNIIQPTTTVTSDPVQVKLVRVNRPSQEKKTFKIVPQSSKSQIKIDSKPVNTVLISGNLNIRSEKASEPVRPPVENILKLDGVRVVPKPKTQKILVEVPETTNKTIKLVKRSPNPILETSGSRKILRLVPADELPKRKRIIVSDLDYNEKKDSRSRNLYKVRVPASYDDILLEERDVRPHSRHARVKLIRPATESRVYIPRKSSSKAAGKTLKLGKVVLVNDKDSDSFSDSESDIDEINSGDSEFSTLVLKKVTKKRDSEKPTDDSKPNIEAMGKRQQHSTFKEDSSFEGKSENIESNDSGSELAHSSLSESSDYETNSEHKSYNETISTGKSILGYSILTSSFLFTIFIIMKLFLL